MTEQAPNIDVKPGDGGRLVYDKERRTIVAEHKAPDGGLEIDRLKQRIAVLEMVILEELRDCDEAANQMIVDGIRERHSPGLS